MRGQPPGSGGPQPRRRGGAARAACATAALLAPFAAGVGVYLFGSRHTPDYATGLFGQHGNAAVDLKARLGTALLALALLQLGLAAWMYGRLPGAAAGGRPVRLGHRATGWLAFLLSLPIAYHCLVTYGIETTSTRVEIHSVTGCVLYGAFVAKVVVVRSRRLPGLLLPVLGGVLFLSIALLWYTAALWALNDFSVPGLS
jgi:hypothetical protein